MSALLEKLSIRDLVQPISVDAYHRIQMVDGAGLEATELIQGIIIRKMTKGPLHSSVFLRLCRFFYANVSDEFLVRPEVPLTLANSEPEPDMSLVRGSENDYREHHPSTAELVIEIAVSSLELDRAKASLYAAANIPFYWIIIPEEQIVEVYSRPEGDAYASLERMGLDQVLPNSADMRIKLRDLL